MASTLNLKSRSYKIGVLAGGPSSEREISLRSGRAVSDALTGEGLNAIFLDVRDDLCAIIERTRIDFAFIALHGRFGEDGSVQKILEAAHIPYTGSGVEASRRALDKIASKEIFVAEGIPTADFIVLEKGTAWLARAQAFPFPAVVKPQYEGSSIGLSVVPSAAAVEAAVIEAFRHDAKALLERYIDGRELTVGIVEDRPLAPIEIVPKNKIYDYRAKYSDPETKYLAPAPISSRERSRAQELARRAHTALGCRSFSRVDMMMDRVGEIFVLEVNTIPGMTERSLLPKAAAVEGLSFGKLCVKLIEDALR